METIYVTANWAGQPLVRNTYSGMTQDQITAVLTTIGCTNIQFLSHSDWAATEPVYPLKP